MVLAWSNGSFQASACGRCRGFFFLSGVLFRKTLETNPIGHVVLAKIKSLVVPYILWCVIGCVITVSISDGGLMHLASQGFGFIRGVTLLSGMFGHYPSLC